LDPDSTGSADPDWTQPEFNLYPLLLKFAQNFAYSRVAVAEAGGCSGGSVIKLPPRAGAVITNYGSRSGSLQFYQTLKEILQKKVMFAEKCENRSFSGKHDLCSCRSWIRGRNSDLRLHAAGAERTIYGSAISQVNFVNTGHGSEPNLVLLLKLDSIGSANPDWTQPEFNLSPLLLKYA
jgi:hypothetical protein